MLTLLQCGTLLDPRFKQFAFALHGGRDAAVSVLKAAWARKWKGRQVAAEVEDVAQEEAQEEAQQKRGLLDDYFGEDDVVEAVAAREETDELEAYLQAPVLDRTLDILQY